MHLIEILLPLKDNYGKEFPESHFDFVKRSLTDRFGGLTAFTRSPAAGFWQDKSGSTKAEDVIVLEVMSATLEAEWWQAFREDIEVRFAQEEIVIRAHAIQRL